MTTTSPPPPAAPIAAAPPAPGRLEGTSRAGAVPVQCPRAGATTPRATAFGIVLLSSALLLAFASADAAGPAGPSGSSHATAAAGRVARPAAEPPSTADRLHALAVESFRRGRFADAYGRFVDLANAGHPPAARIALWMCEHGTSLFGSPWDCAPHEVDDWARCAGVARPAALPSVDPPAQRLARVATQPTPR